MIRGAGGGGERWTAPVLGAAPGPVTELREFAASLGPGGDHSAQFAQGREEGFAQGREEGLQAARQEMAAGLHTLAAMIESVREPMARLDQEVEDELVRLAIAIARQVVRRELATDPQQIAAVVREARAALNDVRGQLRIALHPDEAPLVRRMFSEDETVSGVYIDEDPSVARGGCTLSTEVSFVDAQVETRIAHLAVQLLGDERGEAGQDSP